MTEFTLLPGWPLLVGAVVLIAAFVGWCLCAVGGGHRTTRNIGVTFCEDCSVVCCEAYPCFCCRSETEHTPGITGVAPEHRTMIGDDRG